MAYILQMYSFEREKPIRRTMQNGNQPQTPKTTWSRRRSLLYTVIIVSILLLLVEGVFRIRFYFQYRDYSTSLSIQGNTIQQDDSLLVFRNRSFYLDYEKRYQHNAEGMRSKPGEVQLPEKKAGDYWVFLLGGSAMEGMGSNKDGEWLDITGKKDFPWNETIAWKLQEVLQQAMPDKKVRVFNAANSSFTLQQSYLRCKDLLSRYRADFVVSLDGQNNPETLAENQTVMDWSRADWAMRPTRYFPTSWILPLSTHSAAIYTLKQYNFHRREDRRTTRNAEEGYPRRTYWSGQPLGKLTFSERTPAVDRAVNAYYEQLNRYDSLLTAKQIPHLLLLQPHLIFRDPAKLKDTEKAVWNYYCAAFNTAERNRFLLALREQFVPAGYENSKTVRILSAPDSLDIPVFTDYCHFTPEANQYLVQWIAEQILLKEP